MNLRASDYLLTRFTQSMQGQMKFLGDVETDMLGSRLDDIAIDRPVFITGLARSGTTLLLNLLAELPQVATHRYSDFPFLFVPIAWNRLQRHMARAGAPVERPHRDRIRITKDSPEAFEEPIWAHFFTSIHDPGALHRLTGADRKPTFDAFFLQHLRKVLLLRSGSRYVSKGNYNVTRIEYLASLFPDARFVVPIRHPVAQVESLMRQHALFTDYAAQDPRVPEYLRAAGHFEFGPQRVPVNIDAAHAGLIAQAWSAGEDDLGYAHMWRSVYSHVASLQERDAALGGRIAFMPYEELCKDAPGALEPLARFCELEEGLEELLRRLPEVAPRKPDGFRLTELQRSRVWNATKDIAGPFGYRAEPAAP